MSDEWWVMEIEWRKLSDGFLLSKQALSLHKSAYDRTGFWYDFSSPSIAYASTIVFVPPSNNVESKKMMYKMC